MSKDLVTVVITTYNRKEKLKKAVDSVRKQTYSPIEVIVVDDASDDVVEINDAIKVVRHKTNKGLAAARNTGFKIARGKYVAFLDDDDQFKEDKIEKQVNLITSLDDKYAFVYCGQKVVRPNGTHFFQNPKLKGDIKESILSKGISSISSTYLFRKSALEEIGGFDESLKNNIDHDLWMTFASRGWYCDYVNEPLTVNYRNVEQKRLTTDVEKRVEEVEKYIRKWKYMFRDWYGENHKGYIEKYRYRVYSMLANDRFMRGDLSGGFRVYVLSWMRSFKPTFLNLPKFILRALVLYSLSVIYKFVSPRSKIRYY